MRDGNPDSGNLYAKLGRTPDAGWPTDELSTWLPENPQGTLAELAAGLGQGPHGVRYVPSPAGDTERMAANAGGAYPALLARLRDYAGVVLVDCGTGLQRNPMPAVLAEADQLLLVTNAAADTAQLVVDAAQHLPAVPTWLIANMMPAKGAQVDLEQMLADLPNVNNAIRVPQQPLTENIVTPDFDWRKAPAGWRLPLRQLVAELAAGSS